MSSRNDFRVKRWHTWSLLLILCSNFHTLSSLCRVANCGSPIRPCDTRLFEDIDLRFRVCLASLSIFPGSQTSSNHRISIERIPRMQMRKIFFTGHSEGKFHKVSRYQVRLPVDSFLLGVHLSADICYHHYCFWFDISDFDWSRKKICEHLCRSILSKCTVKHRSLNRLSIKLHKVYRASNLKRYKSIAISSCKFFQSMYLR